MGRALRSLAVLTVAATAGAQDAAPTVTDVRLDTKRSLAERFSGYVKVAKGRPLSPADVRQSVELLFATGEFEDVLVETEPAPWGVAVVFRPRPAPRMSALRIRGDRALGEKELQRMTRLRSDEPLWDARLEEAGRDAALGLAERGFLEAQVQATAQREERGATAVFDVHAGPLARVAESVVEGAPKDAAGALQAQARPRPGEAWRRSLAEKAAEKMRRELVARGRWRAKVEVRELYDPKAARVKLRFEVQPGPWVSVGFRGSRVGAELRRRVERVVKEGGARGDVLEEALDRIEQDLHALGHRSPSLSHHEEETPGDRLEIVYEIEAGEASQVASVRVVGVDEDGFLMPLETQAGTPLRDDVLERDATALTRALSELGFAEARVETEIPEGGGDVAVVFRARTGPKSVVESVTVEAPPETDVAVPALLTQTGDLYRLRTIVRDKATLAGAWSDAGYLRAAVEPKAEWSDDKRTVKVVFHVLPGSLTRVGDVVLAGLRQTREQVVRRELGFAPGEPFSPTKVLDAQRRLQGLGTFERVSAREILSGAGTTQPLVIALEEAPRAAVAYGLGYAERDLLRGSVEVTLRNLYGMDRSLSSFARVSFRGSRLVATYREPRLFSRKQELFVTGFREEQDRDPFDFIRTGGQLQAARALSQRFTLILRLTYQRTNVFNVTVPLEEIGDRQFRSSTFAGPSSSLVFDSRNDPIDPRSGHFVGADLGLSHGVLGGDSFAKAFLQASSFSPLFPRVVLALQARLGLARTFRNEPPRLPLPDRFFAGGDYSVRGFKTDFVGPLEVGTNGALQPTGGNALLVGGVELRIATARRVELAAFGDVGNVYPLVSALDLSDLRCSAGLGLRYKSSIGPIRVDWGYKLNRRAGESPYQFHVTVGHAF